MPWGWILIFSLTENHCLFLLFIFINCLNKWNICTEKTYSNELYSFPDMYTLCSCMLSRKRRTHPWLLPVILYYVWVCKCLGGWAPCAFDKRCTVYITYRYGCTRSVVLCRAIPLEIWYALVRWQNISGTSLNHLC